MSKPLTGFLLCSIVVYRTLAWASDPDPEFDYFSSSLSGGINNSEELVEAAPLHVFEGAETDSFSGTELQSTNDATEAPPLLTEQPVETFVSMEENPPAPPSSEISPTSTVESEVPRANACRACTLGFDAVIYRERCTVQSGLYPETWGWIQACIAICNASTNPDSAIDRQVLRAFDDECANVFWRRPPATPSPSPTPTPEPPPETPRPDSDKDPVDLLYVVLELRAAFQAIEEVCPPGSEPCSLLNGDSLRDQCQSLFVAAENAVSGGALTFTDVEALYNLQTDLSRSANDSELSEDEKEKLRDAGGRLELLWAALYLAYDKEVFGGFW